MSDLAAGPRKRWRLVNRNHAAHTFRFRILLTGILIGVVPLFTISFAFHVLTRSQEHHLTASLMDILTREGQRLERQQQAMIMDQVRTLALNLALDISHHLQFHGHAGWEALKAAPAFRRAALQSLGSLAETFLLEGRQARILLHARTELEGAPLEAVLSVADPAETFGRWPATQPFLQVPLLSVAGQPARVQAIFVRVPSLPPGFPELFLAVLPHPEELARLVAPAHSVLKTALNQSNTLLNYRLRRFQNQIVLLLLGLGLLGFFATLLLARRLTAGIAALSKAAEAFNRGDLDYRLNAASDDEFSRLGQTLNRMAASLKENTVSRFLWENTFNIIPDLIMILDQDQRLTRLNQAAAQYLGITPEEAVGRPCREVMPGPVESAFATFFPGSLDFSLPNRGRNEFYWEHQGRTFLGTINLLQDGGGRHLGAVLVARDITTVQQMQRDLAQASHFLNQIINAAPLALSVVNAAGLFTHVNPQVAVEYGYSPEELLDRHFSIMYANETELERVLTMLRQRGEVLNQQVQFLHKNGHRVPARLSIRKLYGENGEVLGSVALSSNISEEISLKRQLEAAQKQETIATLASGLAHNFNNLLMIIIGLTTLMLSKISPDHPFYGDLQEIERQVKAGREITRKLLSFHRGTSEEIRPLDLNNLVEFTADMFARTRRELTVVKELDRNLPAVEADPGQLQQVLMNLLINAWHAMPNGGRITLRTQTVTLSHWSEPHFNPEPGVYVCLSVADTGIGMDEETKAHLFEPFFTTKEPGQGSGLGLASAQRIIKHHQGAIRVISSPGEGATFEIFLPASQSPPLALTPVHSQVVTGRGTILVVDDEPLLRRVASKLLQKLGYQVLEAADGETAIAIFQENSAHIDLVMLDMVMPGLNGYQTLERLRSLNPHLPVLICSGYGEEHHHNLPPDVGFLSKPYPLETLSQHISEALRRRLH